MFTVRRSVLAAFLVSLAAVSTPATAASFVTIWKFSGVVDGAHPTGPLVRDPSGALYGAATFGGINAADCDDGCGTDFKLTPPAPGKTAWVRTVLHKFKGGLDGIYPFSLQLLNGPKVLVGVTENGGIDTCDTGCGTIFRLTAPAAGQTVWAKTALYNFKGEADGFGPYGSLWIDSSGALFGATTRGVPQPNNGNCFSFRLGCGTAFKLTPPAAGQTKWTETVLHAFTGGADGGEPLAAGLIRDSSGKFYGTTIAGGSSQCSQLVQNGCGVVYSLTPPAAGQTKWTARTLYAFKDNGDGTAPVSDDRLLRNASGVLFGATIGGGAHDFGAIFSLTPPAAAQTNWTERTLYAFKGNADGSSPYAGLVADSSGALYGTTAQGGSTACANGCGTLFKLSPPGPGHPLWMKTILHRFAGGPDGSAPVSRMIPGGPGMFYGMTRNGGSTACTDGCGTVFKLTL